MLKQKSTASIKCDWELNVDYIAAKSRIMEALGENSKQWYTHRWIKTVVFVKSLLSQMRQYIANMNIFSQLIIIFLLKPSIPTSVIRVIIWGIRIYIDSFLLSELL